MLTNWPYTLLIIMPTNRQLEAAISGGDRETRERLMRWGQLHAVNLKTAQALDIDVPLKLRAFADEVME